MGIQQESNILSRRLGQQGRLVLQLVDLAAGLGGGLYLSRFLESLLFGVQPYDPATFAGVAVLFLAIAALACYVPARRATRIDPVVALRAE